MLAITAGGRIGGVEWVLLEGTAVRMEGDEPAINKGELDGAGG